MKQSIEQSPAAEAYLPFVRRIAVRVARRLPQHVTADDLVGAGTIGLMEALGRYDPAGGRSFETYAEFRIKGAMLDELRAFDPVNRAARSGQNRIERARKQLTAQLGRPPEHAELAAQLELSEEELDTRLAQLDRLQLVAEDRCELVAPSEQTDQEHCLARQRRVAAVRRALEALPARLQLITNLYYVEDLSQQQIGELLGVTESRICQLLGEARAQLRRRLTDQRE